MKTVTKIAMIVTLLASGITAASAQQNRTRAPNDPPAPGIMSAPSYYGGYGAGGGNDLMNYRSGNSDTNPFATPGSQEERDIGNQGG